MAGTTAVCPHRGYGSTTIRRAPRRSAAIVLVACASRIRTTPCSGTDSGCRTPDGAAAASRPRPTSRTWTGGRAEHHRLRAMLAGEPAQSPRGCVERVDARDVGTSDTDRAVPRPSWQRVAGCRWRSAPRSGTSTRRRRRCAAAGVPAGLSAHATEVDHDLSTRCRPTTCCGPSGWRSSALGVPTRVLAAARAYKDVTSETSTWSTVCLQTGHR